VISSRTVKLGYVFGGVVRVVFEVAGTDGETVLCNREKTTARDVELEREFLRKT
jgi:hypothetical protein